MFRANIENKLKINALIFFIVVLVYHFYIILKNKQMETLLKEYLAINKASKDLLQEDKDWPECLRLSKKADALLMSLPNMEDKQRFAAAAFEQNMARFN